MLHNDAPARSALNEHDAHLHAHRAEATRRHVYFFYRGASKLHGSSASSAPGIPVVPLFQEYLLIEPRFRWCLDLTGSIASWLETLRQPDRPGQVKFCREGNLLEPSQRAGLGASCLALKIAYQIGHWDRLDGVVQQTWVDHVRSFQSPTTGLFEDPVLLSLTARTTFRNIWKPLSRQSRVDIIRAESRQAAAALLAVENPPLFPFNDIPDNPRSVRDYLDQLPWYLNPWHSASQTSHLVFFWKMNCEFFAGQERFRELFNSVMKYLDYLQDHTSGAWFGNSRLPRAVPLSQRVNAAMKVLTIYRLLNQPVPRADRLIDLCLAAIGNRDACHSVDVIFALHECCRWTNHRRAEIESKADAMLMRIRDHARADGAFSFSAGRAGTSYYGARVSRGLPESDVHGTHLLVWAVTLCADLLGFKTELGWRLPVT